MKKYGQAIRALREKNKDTREELAAKLGLSESGLGKYERGERKITPELLEQIARVYDVKVSNFFGEEGVVPEELKSVGAEWIAFAKEMKQKNLTPEQIKTTLEFLEKMGLTKK